MSSIFNILSRKFNIMYTTVILGDRYVQTPAIGCAEVQIGVHNGQQKLPSCTRGTYSRIKKKKNVTNLFYD